MDTLNQIPRIRLKLFKEKLKELKIELDDRHFDKFFISVNGDIDQIICYFKEKLKISGVDPKSIISNFDDLRITYPFCDIDNSDISVFHNETCISVQQNECTKFVFRPNLFPAPESFKDDSGIIRLGKGEHLKLMKNVEKYCKFIDSCVYEFPDKLVDQLDDPDIGNYNDCDDCYTDQAIILPKYWYAKPILDLLNESHEENEIDYILISLTETDGIKMDMNLKKINVQEEPSIERITVWVSSSLENLDLS